MENKLPLASIITDLHIKESNYEDVLNLVIQVCKESNKLGIKILFLLGDIFDSRKSQPLIVLNTFGKILDILKDYEIKAYVIPGNHDKTIYESNDSFLDSFSHHPSLRLTRVQSMLPFKNHDLFIHFIPFFTNEKWLETFKDLKDHWGKFEEGKKHILCSHIAIEGSRNNDGKRVESNISAKLFKNFYKVFLGHYHNQQQIGKNVFHLPSIQQNSFGENNEKGFTVLYSDGSHELFKTKFKEFVNVKIDLDKISKSELNDMITDYGQMVENNYIRFKFTGSEEKIKTLDKEQIQLIGIDVKTENKDIEVIDDFDSVEISKYDFESVSEAFEEFCEDYKKDYDFGIKYLNKINGFK